MSNCEVGVQAWFDDQFGIPHSSLPVRFLGVPLISSKLSINDCMPLLERITKRINTWSTLLLSFSGRVQLTRAVLFSIQAYWTNHFILPGKIHKLIQKLLTRFLWKGDIDTVGGAKVSWTRLCMPKEEGGLNLKNLEDWNKAQILFHLCKIVGMAKSLWATWVRDTALKRNYFWVMEAPTDCSWI